MSQQQQQQQSQNGSSNNSGASGSANSSKAGGAKSHGPSWQSQYWGESGAYSDIVMAGKAHYVMQYKQDGTPDMRYRLSKEAVAMGCEYGDDDD